MRNLCEGVCVCVFFLMKCAEIYLEVKLSSNNKIDLDVL